MKEHIIYNNSIEECMKDAQEWINKNKDLYTSEQHLIINIKYILNQTFKVTIAYI